MKDDKQELSNAQPTRDWRVTVQERAERDPLFAEALKNELEKENLKQI